MIELTRLNKKKFILNCEIIETLEATPDTVICLRNGKLLIVSEPPEEVVAKTVAYKQSLYEGLLNVVVKERYQNLHEGMDVVDAEITDE